MILPLYSFCFPFSPIDTETIRPATLWIYVPSYAVLNPSSSLPEFLLVRVPSHPSLYLPAIHLSTYGNLYHRSRPTVLRSIMLWAWGKLPLSEFVWLRKTRRGLSEMKKRDAEKRKWQHEWRKAANHLHNSEHGSEGIANSTMDAKGVLFFAL